MGQNALFEEYRSPLHVLCGRLLIVALVPGVIAMASEHWLAAPEGWEGQEGSVWHLGLWAVCCNFSRCASLPSSEFPDAYAPVRGLGVTSLCLHVLSVVVGLVCSCEDPENLLGVNVYVPRLEETLALMAGLLMAGALGIFAQSSQQHPVYHSFHLGWSFWLMLLYVCSLLIAGGVIVLNRYQCACRKKCERLRHHHHHQKTRCFGNRKHRPVQTTDHPMKTDKGLGHFPKEMRLKYFVEPLKGSTGLENSNGLAKPSGCESQHRFLDRVKGPPPHVYSSLEGIPRSLPLMSDKPEHTEVV